MIYYKLTLNLWITFQTSLLLGTTANNHYLRQFYWEQKPNHWHVNVKVMKWYRTNVVRAVKPSAYYDNTLTRVITNTLFSHLPNVGLFQGGLIAWNRWESDAFLVSSSASHNWKQYRDTWKPIYIINVSFWLSSLQLYSDIGNIKSCKARSITGKNNLHLKLLKKYKNIFPSIEKYGFVKMVYLQRNIVISYHANKYILYNTACFTDQPYATDLWS